MPNNLIIFDVDGTLTDTVCMDSDIFLDAFIGRLGIEELNSNWDEYKYSTDSGFALEIFKKHIGRVPSDSEISEIKEDFFSALLNRITQEPTCCVPIPGAKFIFNHISQIEDWDTAIATGGWENSALMKLKCAEIDYQGSPLATGDDHIERREIINIAIEKSKRHYAKDSYDQVIYVGDRHWDYRAAQDLGIRFIGIGHELRKANLNIPIIIDYMDDSLVDLLGRHIASVME